VGNVCRPVPHDVALQRPIYLGLLVLRPPLKKDTGLKNTSSGCILDVGHHVTVLEVG